MDRIDQMDKVVHGAVFRIDGAIVPIGVGTAKRTFFVLDTYRVDRHQPENVNAERGDARKVSLQRAEGSLGGVAARINFVNDAVAQLVVGVSSHIKCLRLF